MLSPPPWVYAVGIALSLAITFFVLYLLRQQNAALSKHHAMTTLRINKLPASSATRKRIESAQKLFSQGWQVLKSKDPSNCLECFAKAVEIDELGCVWKTSFEAKLEQIGEFFTYPPKDDRDKYHSMLAEAYLVVLLFTVLSAYGKQEKNLEEDFEVVKTRLDVCVKLQPKNPAAYKLRADMLGRFGHLASRREMISDLKEAIKLALADEDGKELQCEGVNPKEQRAYLLAFCYHQLAGLLHRNKEMDAAFEAYQKAVDFADPYFINLADCCFSLSILSLVRSKSVQLSDKPGILLRATQYYKAGLEADKRVLQYLPASNTDVSKLLAKELIKKFAKTAHTGRDKAE